MPGSAFDPGQLDRPAITPPSPRFLAAFEHQLALAEEERLERETVLTVANETGQAPPGLITSVATPPAT